jgi:hypothetical protein
MRRIPEQEQERQSPPEMESSDTNDSEVMERAEGFENTHFQDSRPLLPEDVSHEACSSAVPKSSNSAKNTKVETFEEGWFTCGEHSMV